MLVTINDGNTIALPRNNTVYSDNDKQQALYLLAQCDGNLRKAARLTQIPWTALRGWTQQLPDTYNDYFQFFQKRNKENLARDFENQPNPNPLVADLRAKSNLLLGAITPERLEGASLTQITRALASLLPRLQSLEKTATDYNAIEYAADVVYQVTFVLRRYIHDLDLLNSITVELERIAPLPTNLTPSTNEQEGEDTQPSEMIERVTSDSPLPRSLSECPGEGLGVRSGRNERANTMSETSERGTSSPSSGSEDGYPRAGVAEGPQDRPFTAGAGTAAHPTSTSPNSPKICELSEMSERDERAPSESIAPTSPHQPLPPSLERGTSGREGGSDECLHSAPGGLGKKPFVPPTLEELLAIKPNVRWAGGA